MKTRGLDRLECKILCLNKIACGGEQLKRNKVQNSSLFRVTRLHALTRLRQSCVYVLKARLSVRPEAKWYF